MNKEFAQVVRWQGVPLLAVCGEAIDKTCGEPVGVLMIDVMVAGWALRACFDDKALADQCADNINTAFETYVADRVKEAVEEFRERAVKIIEDNDEVVSSENGRFLQAKRGAIGNQIGTAYVKAIRAIPTEPEAK